jgi:hypothetical protein
MRPEEIDDFVKREALFSASLISSLPRDDDL